jgi:uncharacterized membrane protein YfhO
MKRTKTPIKLPKRNIEDNTRAKIIENQRIDFFEKYLSKSSLLLLIFLIGFIGFFAFKHYLLLDYLFFFKDIGSDSINQDLPDLINRAEYLGNSYSEKWSFYQGMGNAYFRSIPVEPLGFFSYLITYTGYSLFGAKFFIYGRFINIFIFHFLFSGIIFYYYLRTISVQKYSAIIGALFVVFSGYMVMGSSWGFSGQVFGGVFMLFAFEQLLVKNRWYFFPFAVIYLSGNPFSLYIYSIFLLTYSLFRYFSASENKITGYLILSGKMIGLGLIGLLMNFINFWRSFSIMFFSPRVAGNTSLADELITKNTGIDYSSHNASSILRFFSNDILGSGIEYKGWQNYFESPAFYIGILSLLILSQIFTLVKKREAIIFGIFASFWLISVFVPPLRYAILLYTGDYYRYGFDFFIPFILLFASIYSLNKLDSGFKINTYTLAATATLLLIFIYFPYKSITDDYIDKNIRQVVTVLILIYSILIYLFSVNRYKNPTKIALFILIIFELSYFSYKSYETRNPLTKEEYIENMGGYKDGTPEAVRFLENNDKQRFYRTEKDYQSGNAMHGSLNDAQAQGYYGTAQYSSFSQINYVRFLEELGIIPKGDETSTRWITGLRPYPLLLTFANVKYQFSKQEVPEFTRYGFEVIKNQNGIKILKNKFYLPFGYTYNKYIDYKDFIELKTFKITGNSLQNIISELGRIVPTDRINTIFASIQPILDKEFNSEKEFYEALQSNLTKEDFRAFKYIFIRHSTNNFKNQTALLNGFVVEKNRFSDIDLSKFTKIEPSDSNILIPPEKFNFNYYKAFTDSLKKDTFQITSFSQSKIEGTIHLKETKLLFFTIPYDEGWTFTVNEKKYKPLLVNIGFSGIVLTPGSYHIEMCYLPKYYKTTNYISVVFISGFWIFLFYSFYRKRKNKNKLG